MAIEGLQGIYRPVVTRREKDAEENRRGRKEKPSPEKQEEAAEPEKGRVDIKV
jgi:hypothetical protein